MAKKIVAIVGTYRKGMVIDTAVSAVLKGAEAEGAQTTTIYLTDKQIEFCTNCRTCMQQAAKETRGKCIHDDDMEEILQQIDDADAVVLAAPVNVGSLTAITRRFLERLAVFRYWPWGRISAPKYRITQPSKKAVILTSCTVPSCIARVIMPGPIRTLKTMAKSMGANVVKSLYFGMVGAKSDSTLGEKPLRKAFKAGQKLAR